MSAPARCFTAAMLAFVIALANFVIASTTGDPAEARLLGGTGILLNGIGWGLQAGGWICLAEQRACREDPR